MHPVHDIDALLLLAMALSAKRRPAELVEIIAAADLLRGTIPYEPRLAEAFRNLSRHGLIGEVEGAYILTEEAQEIVADLPKKAGIDEHIFVVRGRLSAFTAQAEHAAVVVTAERLAAAISAHRNAGKSTAKNLLVPKPKVSEDNKPQGLRQRKPLPKHRRKD